MASLTLADIGRRMDPGGRIMDMSEIMSQCSELDDALPLQEGNLPTGHVVTLRTSLPRGTFRRFNQGVSYTKSGAAQLTFGMAMLDAYSQIDKKLADLGGNTNANREKEDTAHMEGLSQQWNGVELYGNSWTTPEQFSGLATYFSAIANTHGFLLVLPDASQDGACRMLDRLRAIIADLDWSAFSPGMRVTISAGVATLRGDENPDSFLVRADGALYAAKARGRNRIASA